MKIKIVFIVLIALHTLIPKANAYGLKDIGEEAAVPVTTDAKYVLIGGAVLTLGFVAFEDEIIDPFQEKQVRNKTLGDSSIYGDLLGQLVLNGLYIGGMSIAGYYKDPKGYDRALGMLKATLYASATTTVLKYTIREPRPYDKSEKNSFPSGHTTTAFAFSGYVAAEHGWGWGAPALALSTFVGYSRINDNAHYLHDVIAGATIGWVYGWGISKYEKQKKGKSESAYIAPILDTHTAGLSLYKEF